MKKIPVLYSVFMTLLATALLLRNQFLVIDPGLKTADIASISMPPLVKLSIDDISDLNAVLAGRFPRVNAFCTLRGGVKVIIIKERIKSNDDSTNVEICEFVSTWLANRESIK